MTLNKKRMIITVATTLVITGALMANSTYAQQATKTLKIVYNNIKLVYNGKTITSNTGAEAFTIDGTTYVPLRMAGEALNKNVTWDSAKKQIVITDKRALTNNNMAVATVNGVAITNDKLYNELLTLGGAQTLDNLITEELIEQALKKANVTVTDADLTKEILTLKNTFGTEEEFNAALTQAGMTLDTLKKEMNSQVKIRKLIEPQVKITDADIKKYFDDNSIQFDTEEQVRASHILVATKEEAQSILKELQGGTDFATLATSKSLDEGSKETGGDLDFFTRDTMVAPFETAAFALNIGQLSNVVESEFGFHIIKVTDRKKAHTATLKESSAEIKELLIAQQVSSLTSTWLADLRKNAKVTNTLNK